MSAVGCDYVECWYDGNLDRIDEFKGLSKFRVNNPDAYADEFPTHDAYTVRVCDVCVHNMRHSECGFCSVCGTNMLDEWMPQKMPDVCRLCMEDAGYDSDAVFDSTEDMERAYEEIERNYRKYKAARHEAKVTSE